jgi:signal-transduction protein with cAMP-binding, CBS, and nucleotidyltransferase domain
MSNIDALPSGITRETQQNVVFVRYILYSHYVDKRKHNRQILHKNPLFRDLKDTQIKEVNREFSSQHFDKGDPIIRTGEKARHFYIIATGVAKLIQLHESGRMILHDILSSGDYQ